MLRGHIYKNHQQRWSTERIPTSTIALLPLVALGRTRREPFKEAVIPYHGALRFVCYVIQNGIVAIRAIYLHTTVVSLSS